MRRSALVTYALALSGCGGSDAQPVPIRFDLLSPACAEAERCGDHLEGSGVIAKSGGDTGDGFITDSGEALVHVEAETASHAVAVIDIVNPGSAARVRYHELDGGRVVFVGVVGGVDVALSNGSGTFAFDAVNADDRGDVHRIRNGVIGEARAEPPRAALPGQKIQGGGRWTAGKPERNREGFVPGEGDHLNVGIEIYVPWSSGPSSEDPSLETSGGGSGMGGAVVTGPGEASGEPPSGRSGDLPTSAPEAPSSGGSVPASTTDSGGGCSGDNGGGSSCDNSGGSSGCSGDSGGSSGCSGDGGGGCSGGSGCSADAAPSAPQNTARAASGTVRFLWPIALAALVNRLGRAIGRRRPQSRPANRGSRASGDR